MWWRAADEAGDGLVAAVFDGGDQAVAGLLSADDWRRLWASAAHVVAHDAKALPGFAAATSDPAFDTAIAAYLIAPERPESDLFKLARVDEEHVAEGPHLEALAATRAVLTWRLCAEQRTRLAELGLETLFTEVELPLVRVLAAMEAVGVAIDLHRLGEITARLRDRLDEVRDLIFELAGGEFTDRLDPAGRRGAVHAPRPAARAQGQDRLLDRRPGPQDAARAARDRAADRGVA